MDYAHRWVLEKAVKVGIEQIRTEDYAESSESILARIIISYHPMYYLRDKFER